MLRARGATEQQLNGKIVGMIEEAWVDDEAVKSATVKARLNEMSGEVATAQKAVNRLEGRISEYERKLRLADQSISEHIITDSDTIDGLIAYERVLRSVKDVFGEEKMTEEVICKAIEAASYGMWRSIMGPKETNSRNKQRY